MSTDLVTAAFHGAPIAMAVVSAAPPHAILAANAAFGAAADGNGTGRASTVGRPLTEVLGPEVALETALVEACGGATARLVTCQRRDGGLRYAEVLISSVDDTANGRALLYVSRDVTDVEAGRRALESAHDRVTGIETVARELRAFSSAPVLQAAVVAAAATCEGAAFVLLVGDDKTLTRAASHAMPPGLLPNVLAFADVPCAARALRTSQTEQVVFSVALARLEQALLRSARATWLVASPILGHRSALGVVVTLWRRTTRPPTDHLSTLELIGGQIGIALEHERLLRTSEAARARLELVLDGMPDAVWIVGANGTVERMNRAGARLVDRESRTNVPLPPVAELSARFQPSSDDADDADPLGLRRALAGETVHDIDATLLSRQREIALRSSAVPLRDPTGTIVGAVGISRDVTDQQRTDAAIRLLAHASAELGATLDYQRSLAAVARVTVTLRVADWCIIDVLEADGTVLRLPVAHHDADDAPVARQLRANVPQPVGSVFAETLAGSGARAYPWVRASSIAQLSRDPSEAYLLQALRPRSLLLVPIVSRGRRFGVVHLLRTTTRRPFTHNDTSLAEELADRAAMAIDNARLFDEARAADQRKDEFLGILSHELRTPLTSVMVWAGILRQDTDPARVRRAAEVIERNIRIQTALINDLLDLTSISRGKMKLECKRHDLRQILDDAVDIVRSEAEAGSIRLEYERPADALPVYIDAKRVQQVFWNILNNAIKFTPIGGAVTVRVTNETHGRVVHVADTGEGITPEFLPFAFDMFRQQSRPGNRIRAGLGIGLALAKQLVELHGGTIQARSAGAGTGSEFTVSIPRLDDARAWHDAPAHERVPPALDGICVLVVEDVQDIAAGAKALLEAHGARVVEARNGQEALRLLEHTTVDLVLSDLWMPVMDGFTLVREIRAVPRHGRLPVIAVSGLASPHDVARTRHAGFDAFLRKPFDAESLVTIVRQTLHERAAAEANEKTSAM